MGLASFVDSEMPEAKKYNQMVLKKPVMVGNADRIMSLDIRWYWDNGLMLLADTNGLTVVVV